MCIVKIVSHRVSLRKGAACALIFIFIFFIWTFIEGKLLLNFTFISDEHVSSENVTVQCVNLVWLCWLIKCCCLLWRTYETNLICCVLFNKNRGWNFPTQKIEVNNNLNYCFYLVITQIHPGGSWIHNFIIHPALTREGNPIWARDHTAIYLCNHNK